jgi:hypothetical protein
MTYLSIVAVALLLLALALWKGNGKRRPMVQRAERLTIDHKLVTTNTKMKRIGVTR